MASNMYRLRRRIWVMISKQAGTAAWTTVWEAVRPPRQNWSLIDGQSLWRRVIRQIGHQASEDHDAASLRD
jgi:hypothetical protein